jgi:SAM-dependent MidA family methyltransferase
MTAGETLLSVLTRRIRSQGPIPFEAFMAAALYEPGVGRYHASRPPMGPEGDYITSPEVDPAFGRLLGRALVEMEGRIRAALRAGAGAPFTVIEMGPGTGLLCRDILQGLAEEAPSLFERVRYVLVETSGALRREQRGSLEAAGLMERAEWRSWEEILAAEPLAGCILANEFLDALPVHLVEWSEERPREVYVGLREDGRLEEQLREPSTGEIPRYFEELGLRLAEGQRAEVNLAALRWIREAASLLRAGYAIVIDYGHEARDLFSERHYAGTLLGYRRHQLVTDPLESPGEHDLTSHVDFTSLAREARASGFETWGMTSQRRFLVAMGLAQMIADLGSGRTPVPATESVRRRFALHTLMSPAGMGETFKVLAFGRRASVEGLACLRDPFRDPVEGDRGGV